ncbi:MAG: MFS transporter [Planctomycetota bacterium]
MDDKRSKNAKTSLWSPSFQGLLWTNWLTAINDNIFRWFVIGVGKRQFDVSEHSSIVMLGTVFFVFPYLVVASPAGWLADRFRKRHVIIGCKYAEIGIMTLGILAVMLNNFYILMFTVLLMGAQSALFAPAKVGTIPELLDENTISAGNGIFNLATLSATVIGTAIGALLADITVGGTSQLYIAAITMIGIALVGTWLSYLIHTLPAANRAAKFPVSILGETIRDIIELSKMGRLFRVALGIIFFWTVAGLAQINIDAFADESGALIESERTPLLLSLTLGVGLGSVLAGIVSAGHIELRLVPFGVLGIAVFSSLLMYCPEYFFLADSYGPILIACTLLGGLGVSAGFFDVPLASYLQNKSPIERRGAILSATNCLAFSGVAIVTLIFGGILRVNTDSGGLDQLPDQYKITDSIDSMGLPEGWFSSAKQTLERFDEKEDQIGIEFPADLSPTHKTQLISQLVWDDYARLQAEGEEQSGIAKYSKIFNNLDEQRQVKLVVRTAAPQPRFSARQIFFLAGIFTLPVVAYAVWRFPHLKLSRENETNQNSPTSDSQTQTD